MPGQRRPQGRSSPGPAVHLYPARCAHRLHQTPQNPTQPPRCQQPQTGLPLQWLLLLLLQLLIHVLLLRHVLLLLPEPLPPALKKSNGRRRQPDLWGAGEGGGDVHKGGMPYRG